MLSNQPVHPTLATSDLETARSFYTKRLGLEPAEEMEGHLTLACGDGTLLTIYERPGHVAPQNTVASFLVDDVHETVAQLRDRGVEFEEYDQPGLTTVDGIAEDPDGFKGAWFKDLDGNILAISEFEA